MAEKKERKGVKRKPKAAEAAPEKSVDATPAPEPVKADPAPSPQLTVELDDSEFRVIETYTKLWNDRHEGVEGYAPISPAEFLLCATLKWCEYEERGAGEGIEGDELGAEEDATPDDPLSKNDVVTPDPADDDPDFVDALAGRVGGAR